MTATPMEGVEARVLEALAAAAPSPLTATLLLQRGLVPRGPGLMGTNTALRQLVARGFAHEVITGVYVVSLRGRDHLAALGPGPEAPR